MWRRCVLVPLLLLVPVLAPRRALAQEAPERLLPPGCQVYFHWDGFDKHRADFDKTALGKMLKGDTGKFLSYLVTYGRQTLETALRREREAKEALVVFDEVIGVLQKVGQHGFIVGLEIKSVQPPQVTAVIVFPENGKALTGVIDKILKVAREKPQESQVGKRKVFSFSAPRGEVHFGWFIQDGHAVLSFGTGHPAELARKADAGDPGITKNPLYKQVAEFKEFKTWARGYLDLGSAWEMIGGLAPQANQIITDLGLNGLTSVTFVSGFDGPAERGVVEINTTGKRKGLLALLNQKTIKLSDLPPMPDDLTGFSASNLNVANFYEGLIQVAEVVTKVVFPGAAPDVREGIRQFEGAIGVKLGEDLFGSFEGLAVSYSTSSEGPLGLGGVTMLKVKDEKKLRGAIESLVKAVPVFPGFEISVNKKDYRGVAFHELILKTESEFPVFAFTIHKGWFALASYPQPLYGYILREKGDLPVWKASPELTKALEAFPKEFTAISVSDPRPSVQFLLSLVPGVTSLANQLLPLADLELRPFDTSVIPHAREATRHLFPNISVTTDDGKKIRIESRVSLSIPFLN